MNKKTIVVRSKKPKQSFFQKCISFITKRKTFTFLSIAILLIAIPLTVVQSLHIQDLRQQAKESDGGNCQATCQQYCTPEKTTCTEGYQPCLDYGHEVEKKALDACDPHNGATFQSCLTAANSTYSAWAASCSTKYCKTTPASCNNSSYSYCVNACKSPSTCEQQCEQKGSDNAVAACLKANCQTTTTRTPLQCYEACVANETSSSTCQSQCGYTVPNSAGSAPNEGTKPKSGGSSCYEDCIDRGGSGTSCQIDCSTPSYNNTVCVKHENAYCTNDADCDDAYVRNTSYSCSDKGTNFGSCCVKRTSPPVVTPGKKTTVTPAGSGSKPGSTGGKGICLPSGFYSVGGEPCPTPTPVKKTGVTPGSGTTSNGGTKPQTGSTTPGASSPNITSAPTLQTACANNPIQPPVNKIWKAYCSSGYKCVTNDDCKKVLSASGGETQCYVFTNGSYCMQLQFDNIAGTCRDNPETPPGANQVWKADCGGKTCKEHSDCPQNPAYASNPNDKSNWCYGFDDGARCMMLQEKNGNTTASTPTTSSSSATSKSVTSTVIDTITSPFVSAWDAITGFVTGFFK